MQCEISKRSLDGQYAVWVNMVDPGYDPEFITEENIAYLCRRWVTVGVYNDYEKAQKVQKEYQAKR